MRPAILVLLALSPAMAAPPEVVVVKPVEREVFDHADFGGRTEASTTVQIRSRIDGSLDKVLFKEGSAVRKGDLLLQLDDRLQRAEVAKVEAEFRRAEARLKGVELDLSRMTKLADAKGVSREELEKAAAAAEEARATLLAARAGLEAARIHLEFTRITSPIDGRIGRAGAAAGNVVRAAEVLATVYAIDPLYVVFNLDERTLLRLARFTRGRNDDKVTAGLALTGDEGFPRIGVVDFPEPGVDAKTGTLRVRAVLPNPKGEVRPGQAVRVRLPLGDSRKALLVPDTAFVQVRGDGYAVLVVNDKNVLEERPVRIRPQADRMVEVEAGLKPGDRVVRDPEGRKAGETVKPNPPTGAADKPGDLGRTDPPARRLPDFPGTAPALVVTAGYPGADAHAVEAAAAAPIDAQIRGLEKMTHRVLACSDDGSMRLTLLFEKGTDLNKAQVLAQNRVAVALPALPDAVRQHGITVKKRGVFLAAVALVSPKDQYDRLFLANYGKLRLRDELAHVPGVTDVTFYGDAESVRQVRLLIDKEKLARMGLTVDGLANALRTQGLTAEAGPGRVPALTLGGRIADPEQLNRLEVSNDRDQKVPLGAVARVEAGEGWGNTTALDGKRCVMLLVSRLPDADPKATAKALRDHVADLANRAPQGMEVKLIADP